MLTLIRPGGGIYAPLFKNDRISLIWVGRVRMFISLNLRMSMMVIFRPFRGPSDAWEVNGLPKAPRDLSVWPLDDLVKCKKAPSYP